MKNILSQYDHLNDFFMFFYVSVIQSYTAPWSDDSVGQESAELSESNSSITGGIVAGVVVAGVAVLIFLIAACIMFRRKRSRAK